MTMRGHVPYGYENDVTEGEGGWASWKPEKGCPSCEKKTGSDGELLFALICPSCEEPGCDECFPSGRGCDCPGCEDDPYDD